MTDPSIQKLQNHFDELAKRHPDSPQVEFWFARDLQEALGYARWENFTTAIQRAIASCKSTGYNVDDHFRGVTKMVPLVAVPCENPRNTRWVHMTSKGEIKEHLTPRHAHSEHKKIER